MTPWSGSNFRAAVSRPTLPSPMRSMSGRPRFWYFLATEMTKRRLRFTSSWSASWSPARIFLREVDLLRSLEERIGGDLVEVLVEDVALRLVRSDPRGGRAAATALDFGHVRLCLAKRALKSSIYVAATAERADRVARNVSPQRVAYDQPRRARSISTNDLSDDVRERRCKIPADQIFASPNFLTLDIPSAILRGSWREPSERSLCSGEHAGA